MGTIAMNENHSEVLGLAFLAVIWLGPILYAAWIFKKKGRSPHWTWFGLVPIVGLIVLLVALLLNPKQEAVRPDSSLMPVASMDPHARYRKRMRELGNGLIALAVFEAIGAVLIINDPRSVFSLRLVFGLLPVAILTLGILARRLHAWVNYVVAVLGCLGLVLTVMQMGTPPPPDQTRIPSAPFGSCFGLIIAAALLYYAINNLQKLRAARNPNRLQDAMPVLDALPYEEDSNPLQT
jgi:uncharacterized membrane protein YhaH (DUF805 family)